LASMAIFLAVSTATYAVYSHANGSVSDYFDFLDRFTANIFSNPSLGVVGMWLVLLLLLACNYTISFPGYAAGSYLARLIYPKFSRLFLFLGISSIFAALAIIFYDPADAIADRLAGIAEDAASIIGTYAAYRGKGLFWRWNIRPAPKSQAVG
jgi:hypothetical protein